MSDTFTAEINYQGQQYTIPVSADQTVLESAQAAGLDLPFSCSAGVCTTCAAQLTAGTVEQPDAMGLSPDLQEKGYALLCVSYPRSDLKIETEKEDEVYQLQFGNAQ
jgi:ferredoxin